MLGKPFEQPYLVDEPKRFRMLDHGKRVGDYETAAYSDSPLGGPLTPQALLRCPHR
jgi:hypothetical protein